ncbi:MAG: MetQ/NlpA family ABC transporter substrate-binding protein [Eggerthellaceae bacterium]|nr:MetQ/NlpA family ABC transporter substrate-binding protein [Eggerthellaceae bacterium]
MEARKRSKRLAALAVAVFGVVLALGLAGCGGQSGSASASGSSASASTSAAASGDKTITVAASPTPHAQILTDAVAPLLEKEGYKLVVKEFNDYVLPNTATEEGEVDANYFQHIPYLDSFNKENGTHLASVAAVHYEPFGLYAGKTASLSALADGATVAVPNDTTNEARALLLLEQEGLIKLKANAGITATVADIAENPKNLKIRELEAATIPNVLADVDIAAINSNYALGAGLSVKKNALAVEDPNGTAAQTYKNIVVVRDGNQTAGKIQALVKAIGNPSVAEYINKTFDGAVLPVE